jgi:hypothetical protein
LRAQVAPGIRQAPAGQLEAGIATQMIEVVGVLVAAGDGEDTGAQDVGDAVRDKLPIARVADQPRQPLNDTQAALGRSQQHDAPSEVSRPPSKAAVTFLRPTAGKPNGSIVSSDMAGVARCDRGNGWLRHPTRKLHQQLMRHPPANRCHAGE